MQPHEHFRNGIPLQTRAMVSVEDDFSLTYDYSLNFADGPRVARNSVSLRKVAALLQEAKSDRNRVVGGLHVLSQAKQMTFAKIKRVTIDFVAPDGSHTTLKVEVPLERPQKTDLTPEQLVQKYFGG
jgi:hypothetical protein